MKNSCHLHSIKMGMQGSRRGKREGGKRHAGDIQTTNHKLTKIHAATWPHGPIWRRQQQQQQLQLMLLEQEGRWWRGRGLCEMGLAMRVWGCQGDSLEFVSAAKHL